MLNALDPTADWAALSLSHLDISANCIDTFPASLSKLCASILAQGGTCLLDDQLSSRCFSSATDRAALVNLYRTTGGSFWGNNSNWNTSTSMCEWAGVSCDASGLRVTGLALDQNNLVGMIPEPVGALVNLTTWLRLGSNHLSGTIPSSIGRLVALTVVDFHNNMLSGSIPVELCNMINVKSIDWHGNTLRGTIPDCIQSLSSLRFLDVHDNCLAPPSSALMTFCGRTVHGVARNCTFSPQGGTSSRCQSLATDRAALVDLYESAGGPQWKNSSGWNTTVSVCTWFGVSCDDSTMRVVGINLYNNSLLGTIPASIGMLSKLSVLQIGRERGSPQVLSGNVPESLCELSHLSYLDLRNHLALSGSIPCLSSFADLWHLDVRFNRFSGNMSEFSTLPSLRVLLLCGNLFGGVLPGRMANESFEWLDCCDNMIEGVLPTDFARWSQLKYVDLGRNKLSGTISRSIAALSAVWSLNMWGNMLSGTVPPEIGTLPRLIFL